MPQIAAAVQSPRPVALGKLEASAYDKPREALPALRFSFDADVSHGAVLRQLGAPASWSGEAMPADVLEPVVHAAAVHARRIALAEIISPVDGSAPAQKPKRRPRG